MVAIVPSGPPVEIDLDALAPFVRELVSWLGVDECPPALADLVSRAPVGLLDDVRRDVGRERDSLRPWTLNELVRHVLVPLGELSLVDGQPVIPELGVVLVDVLGDPRLGAPERDDVELILLDSEVLEGHLIAESQGG
ncbi:hypothetical protein G6O69_05385 [Pseudenhygromyxa sp. WMMC2535]|uniref:hypothetical protein n=1 Tax=Pseudenhygromyxa sp. WMMC2535 TaxID=2712867 RepID=UPI0015533F8D|nr:hypothetical protein [Pseudenhygromyxa sp. WMMC2535]NVB37253.1 hypothetical protein [Pseudenhygromyxa sp. WMMC2535]